MNIKLQSFRSMMVDGRRSNYQTSIMLCQVTSSTNLAWHDDECLENLLIYNVTISVHSGAESVINDQHRQWLAARL